MRSIRQKVLFLLVAFPSKIGNYETIYHDPLLYTVGEGRLLSESNFTI